MTPGSPPRRKVTRVAVGVLIRSDGHVLLADRPAGKAYAGYWEFPGGKIEPGEDVDAALERELHEELGVDIGASVPWVTFEFDYPHAYVELQFRLVREWRGDPHAREGQRLSFVDPAGQLPQPLLPAAVPALRWLRLPRTVHVVGLQGPTVLPASTADRQPTGSGGVATMLIVDADWRGADAEAAFRHLRAATASRPALLLATGPDAPELEFAAGFVVEAGAIASAGPHAGRLRGVWVGSAEDLQVAAAAGCDFALVRSAALAEQLRRHAAPLPAYLPSGEASIETADTDDWPGQGRWIDLRSPADRRG